MDFGLTEEQTMFRDSVARFLGAEYGFETRQKLVAGGNGFPDNHWSQYAQLGWLAAPFPQDCGGLGGSAVEVALVMEQMGRVDRLTGKPRSPPTGDEKGPWSGPPRDEQDH